ncbi:hypothetical protein [Xanthobacter sp. KR7-225]|uniref:hypothetical protein n=1 Tax=Xanthobacter sp. KR7-225 TaxID=3156613 RepID=UPI0032B575C4
MLIFTGARLREILTLKWTHVDLERGLLLLPDSKTGRKAIVLNAPALAILASLPRLGNFVIAGADPKKPRADLCQARPLFQAPSTPRGFVVWGIQSASQCHRIFRVRKYGRQRHLRVRIIP